MFEKILSLIFIKEQNLNNCKWADIFTSHISRVYHKVRKPNSDAGIIKTFLHTWYWIYNIAQLFRKTVEQDVLNIFNYPLRYINFTSQNIRSNLWNQESHIEKTFFEVFAAKFKQLKIEEWLSKSH